MVGYFQSQRYPFLNFHALLYPSKILKAATKTRFIREWRMQD